jgi:hypothetical protein
MRHASLPSLTLSTLLGLCGGNPRERPLESTSSTIHSYSATEGSFAASTLMIEDAPEGQRLAGVTHFTDGTCLAEEATLDRAGRIVRAEYTVAGTHVVLDPARGIVEITSPEGDSHIQVPNDLPWVWTPLLHPQANTGPVATPLAALVTLRGAEASAEVRSIALGVGKSHRDSSNQLLVKDVDQSELVVVGDDVITIERGLPQKWHVWALDQDVEASPADGLLSVLATFACTPARGSAT